MRERAVVGGTAGAKRETASPSHRRRERGPTRLMRWVPVVVNSALLVGAVVLPHISAQKSTGLITVRSTATCPSIGPVASRYVNRKKACSRARNEVLESLRTGRDPDWGDVIRDSTAKPSEHLRRHKPTKHYRQQAGRDQTSRSSSDATLATPRTRPTSNTETQPSPTGPSATAPTPLKEPQHAPTRTRRLRITPWPNTSAAAIALLALLAVAASMGKRRQTILLVTRSVLSNLKRGLRTKTRATPPTTTDHVATRRTCITSILSKGTSLTGPGAEGAARHLAMEILIRRKAVPADLVLNRPDAWRLFGMDLGTLQEDRIPGLVLTDDHERTRAFLSRQSSSRWLLLAYTSEGEDLPGGRSQIPVIAISTHTEGPARISPDGVVTSATDPSPPPRLPLLARDDAFNLLMSMPTCARPCERADGVGERAPHGR
ncbi:hypothetical protein GCM10009735_37820 [Actinomadura chokoriensis]